MYMQELQDFREIISKMLADTDDPHLFHSMLVHFPIVISLLGLALVVVLLATRNRSGWVRWLCVGLYVLGIVAALMAADAGGDALHAPNTRISDVDAQHEAVTHARMGEMVWIFMAAAAVCVAATMVRVAFLRLLFPLLALVAALTVVGWVAVTAQHGGHLVYVRGLGVPHSENNLTAAPVIPQNQPAPGAPARNRPRTPPTKPRPAATAPNARGGVPAAAPSVPAETSTVKATAAAIPPVASTQPNFYGIPAE